VREEVGFKTWHLPYFGINTLLFLSFQIRPNIHLPVALLSTFIYLCIFIFTLRLFYFRLFFFSFHLLLLFLLLFPFSFLFFRFPNFFLRFYIFPHNRHGVDNRSLMGVGGGEFIARGPGRRSSFYYKYGGWGHGVLDVSIIFF
jgi:hypothetical protein